jgi:ubiquinol-cytochrome c reductase cytochrome c1 subunit
VCATCHSMNLLHYRDLAGLDLTDEQITAIAAAVEVPLGVDDQGNPKTGPATPSSQFRAPFANEQAARAALNGALPPDLSLIVNARKYNADYVYAILTGFTDPPAGFKLMTGMNYNIYFPGHQIAMPQPLHDGQVTFVDGSPNRIENEAYDVVTFLYWAANPEAVQRKQIGVRVVLFLIFMTGMTYAVKRKVWADVH